ncbi:MAG: CpsD/CapB family tyrosine-protein kinase [Thermodesulfobacteriota bacterium]
MSATQPKPRNEEITEQDLFGSIPKALDINPFEGINLDEITVKPKRKGASDDEELIEINPIQGIDIDEISAVSVPPFDGEEQLEIVEINPIEEEHVEGLNDIHPIPAGAAAGVAVSAGILSGSTKPHFLEKLKIFFTQKSQSPTAASPEAPGPDLRVPPKQVLETPSTKPELASGGPKAAKPKRKVSLQSLFKPLGNGTHPPLSPQLVKQAFNYAEVYRIREKILSVLGGAPHKVVMIASPYDNTGNTFMVSVLGLNAAAYTQLNLLLVDLNMRRPQLHVAFGLPLEKGFGDFAQGTVHWSDTVKETELPNLKVISAGDPVKDMANYLNKDFLESFLKDIRNEFDMVILDTSPVLVRNRNNVDPILLGRMSDAVILISRNKHTSRGALVNTVQAIEQDGGNIVGIVYNQ